MAKKNVRAAIERVASRLGNTPTICRKCYIHPEVLNCYLDGSLMLDIKEEAEAELRDNLPGMKPEEAAVLSLLEARIGRELEKTADEAPPASARVGAAPVEARA
jgi:DNA topoisomerase-1